MKKTATIIFLSLIATGCVSQQELVRRQQEAQQWRAAVSAARADATVTCSNTSACNKAFRLAKVYVHDNADMRIQFADDTTISTYNPIEWGLIGIQATKTPSVGDSATIELTAHCKGYEEGSPFFTGKCMGRLLNIYEGFRPFVEGRMK